MFWTPELAQTLEDAPWPATKDELLDYAITRDCPQQVIENLEEWDSGEEIFGIEELWPEYEDILNTKFLYDEDDDDQYF